MNFIKRVVVLSLIAGNFLDAAPHPLESKKRFDLYIRKQELTVVVTEEPSSWGKFFGFQPARYENSRTIPLFDYNKNASMSLANGTFTKTYGDEPSGIVGLICGCIRATQDRDR